MENNELEEMRAQLATLNEKLESESIVDEKHFSEATKNHLSKLQRKLMVNIIIYTAWAAYCYWKLELGIFLFFCLGNLILSIYLYRVARKGSSASMPMAEYARRIRMALKIYKRVNMLMWVLTALLILAWGAYVLILNWPSNLEIVLPFFFVCCFIALFMWVSYYIGYVCVSPDVELMLEQVLEDLDKNDQDEK